MYPCSLILCAKGMVAYIVVHVIPFCSFTDLSNYLITLQGMVPQFRLELVYCFTIYWRWRWGFWSDLRHADWQTWILIFAADYCQKLYRGLVFIVLYFCFCLISMDKCISLVKTSFLWWYSYKHRSLVC